MERFLKDYVDMMADANDIKLTKKQLENIVNNLMNDDYLWETVDDAVCEEIARCVSDARE
jgi:hypothetical protein